MELTPRTAAGEIGGETAAHHLPSVFHELWNDIIEHLGRNAHETARFRVVGVRLIELRKGRRSQIQ